MAANTVFGIDLGTTYSCIAYVDDYGRPVVVDNAEGQRTTPSVVYFEGADNIVVGQAAKEVSRIYPDRVIQTIKRAMGKAEWEKELDGKVYRPQEISSFILRKLATDAAQNTGLSIKDVVITCPAYFGIDQKEATKQAGVLAGLNVLYVIPEPTAAAIAYGIERDTEEIVMVFDLGGGTFDITLIKIDKEGIRVVATGGDDQLGGKNWDDTVVNYFAQQFESELGVPADDVLNDPETYQTLLNDAERAKVMLSSSLSFRQRVTFNGQSALVELTRDKFNEITAPWLNKAMQLTQQMFDVAREEGCARVDKILLIGGSTYMPQVRAALEVQYPTIKIEQNDPNLAVAKGAALFGYKLALEDEVAKRLKERGQGWKDDKALKQAQVDVAKERGISTETVLNLTGKTVINVSSKSFGVVIMDDSRKRPMVSNLVRKDDEVPATAAQQFSTYYDGQSNAEIKVVESEVRTTLDQLLEVPDCSVVGTSVLEFEKALPKGSPIEIKFVLGPDGLLTMDAKDLTTNREIHATMQTKSILSKEELEEARQRMQAITVS